MITHDRSLNGFRVAIATPTRGNRLPRESCYIANAPALTLITDLASFHVQPMGRERLHVRWSEQPRSGVDPVWWTRSCA